MPEDVDRLNRALFKAEVVDGYEAINICRKPRPGDTVYVFQQANINVLQGIVPQIPSSAPELTPS
jgi:hypothetical protein